MRLFIFALAWSLPAVAAAQALGTGHAFDPAISQIQRLFTAANNACAPCAAAQADIGASFAQRCGRNLTGDDVRALATAAPSYSNAIAILTLAHASNAADLPVALATKYRAIVNAVPCNFPSSP